MQFERVYVLHPCDPTNEFWACLFLLSFSIYCLLKLRLYKEPQCTLKTYLFYGSNMGHFLNNNYSNNNCLKRDSNSKRQSANQWAVLPRFLNLLNILKVWYWDPSLLLSTYKLSKFQNLFRYLGHGHLNI